MSSKRKHSSQLRKEHSKLANDDKSFIHLGINLEERDTANFKPSPNLRSTLTRSKRNNVLEDEKHNEQRVNTTYPPSDNRLVSIRLLNRKLVQVRFCPKCSTSNVILKEMNSIGIAHRFEVECFNCQLYSKKRKILNNKKMPTTN